jgi:hypothetical protein
MAARSFSPFIVVSSKLLVSEAEEKRQQFIVVGPVAEYEKRYHAFKPATGGGHSGTVGED